MTRINTNVGSLVAQQNLARSNEQLQTSLTRLSTGLRINTGKDDPAGLIASENLRSDITSANAAISNSQQANQLIATADSALGQISNLLNDIRGLVVQSANTGVLSSDQIAANQLQVDSSLEAIDRIAKVTTFQGRKLLDGTLDFTKAYTAGASTVSDLKVNQANLGNTGSLAVSANITSAATQGAITAAAFGQATPAQASGTLTLANGSLTINAKAGGAADGYVGDTTSVTVQAATGGTQATNTNVGGAPITISATVGGAADGVAGNSTTVTYQAASNIAQATTGATTLTNSGGSITVNAKSGGAYAGAAGNAVSVAYQASSGISQATGTVSLTNSSGSFDLTAVAGGAADGVKANTTQVVLQTASGSNPTSAAYDANTNTLTVSVAAAGDTVQNIANAITADGTFSAANVTGGSGTYNSLDNGTNGVTFAGGSDGTTSASIAGNVITVNVGLNDTITNVAAAIAGINGGADFTSSATSGSSAFKASDFAGAGANLGSGSDGTTTAAYASGTITVNVALGATNAQVATAIDGLADFSASNTGSGAFNVGNFGTTNNALAGGANSATTATYNATTNALTINAGTGATIDDIKAAVNTLADFTATDTSGTGLIANGDLTTHAAGTLTGGIGTGLAADLVVRIAGSKGSEVFNFKAGATANQFVNAVNLVSDATGVQASNSSGTLNLKSIDYGSAGSVDVEVLSEGTGGTFGSALSNTHAAGTDISGTINGTTASGKGNTLSINTSSLDLALTVSNGSTTTVSFNINGGGAVFQLGPDVVTNQQARIGISSVNTATLGGTAGRLYELRSGNDKDLSTDPTGAASIVDEAINKVTSLRGRLGAFQATTLDTNIASLTDTVTNLTAAQSSIRDADFATETANLTRAQVLVQSGTQVLSIANQSPQAVLALLKNA